MAVQQKRLSNQRVYGIFRTFGLWPFTEQDKIDKTGISNGHHVLLYGDLSEKLVSRISNKVGPKGKLYAIGRSRKITELIKFLQPNYRNRIIVNPECSVLPASDVNFVLVVRSQIKPELFYFLSNRVRKVMRQESRMVFIEDAESHNERILQVEKTGWLRLIYRNQQLLVFERIL